MSFKLLAIRPLKHCSPKFLKNLQENRIYKFYDDYKFYIGSDEVIDAKQGDITEIKYSPENAVSENLFHQGETKINISAIVGKNGSGKSALVELLVVSKFLLSNHLIYKVSEHLYNEKINCEIYFEKERVFYKLLIKDNVPEFENYSSSKVENFDLKDFFYSIVINYSIYAFNSLEIGHWIEEIFPKNDSYQIPIVINPKRESIEANASGIIDINNEKELLKQRLLFNFLKPVINDDKEFRKIGDNLVAFVLKPENKMARDINLFEVNKPIINYGYSEEDKKKEFWDSSESTKLVHFGRAKNGYPDSRTWGNVFEIIEAIKEKFKLDFTIIPNSYKIKSYLAYKVTNICDKCIDYESFKSQEEINNKDLKTKDLIDINGFLNKIKEIENRSHITNKLMQTINYVRFYSKVWKKYEGAERISLDELSEDLKVLSKTEKIPLIELIPPTSIFDIDILLKNEKDNSEVKLSGLSSGERQLIYSVSSLVYHINNLESVKPTAIIHKYSEVNIILDEIELYFHPDFQRKFVNYILEAIKNLNSKLKFNILFITHSPFILSDIRKQNVLFLDVVNGKSTPQNYKGDNTFAENIHEMLTGGFFIENTKGAFAISKLNQFLKFYKESIALNKKPSDFENELENYSKIIDLVGEEYVRKILMNHIDELKTKFDYKSARDIDVEKQNLIKRLKEIDPDIKIDGYEKD